MSFYPSRRHADCPRHDTRPYDPASDRAVIAEWLAHVQAGRIGGDTPVNEEARAIVLANERLMCGDRRGGSR